MSFLRQRKWWRQNTGYALVGVTVEAVLCSILGTAIYWYGSPVDASAEIREKEIITVEVPVVKIATSRILIVIVSDADNDGTTILEVEAYLERAGGVLQIGGAWAWLLHTGKTYADVRDDLNSIALGKYDRIFVSPLSASWAGKIVSDTEGDWIRTRNKG